MSSLSLELEATLRVPPRPGARPTSAVTSEDVVVDLQWHRRDPLVVQLQFKRSTKVWLVGRDLLHAGLTAPAGDGDVTAIPDPWDPGSVAVVFSTPNGRAVLELDAVDLDAFLQATYARVPAAADVITDAALAELLRFEGEGSPS